MYRVILLVLNAVAVGFLFHRLLKIYEHYRQGSKKRIVLSAGLVLLLLPVAMIFGFIHSTPVYLVVYPIGIFFFVYLFRLED